MGSAICGILGSKRKIKFEYVQNDSAYSNNYANVGSLMIDKDTNGNFIFKRRENLYISEQIQSIMTKFYLNDRHLNKLWCAFKKMDPSRTGYIKLVDLYAMIKEYPGTSVVSPYLDRFFILIEKEFIDKVSFEELLPNFLSFCLFSVFQIVEFVFNFLDRDHDGYISRGDIIRILSLKREDEDVFYINHTKAIELYPKIKRPDRINKDDFAELCTQLTFIFYPAVQLQRLFRQRYIGEDFWKGLNEDMKNSHFKGIIESEDRRILNKIEEIKKRVFEDRLENFRKRIKAEEEKKNREKNRILLSPTLRP